jgi:hypothetical protein
MEYFLIQSNLNLLIFQSKSAEFPTIVVASATRQQQQPQRRWDIGLVASRLAKKNSGPFHHVDTSTS